MSSLFVVLETPWAGLGAGDKAKSYVRNCIRDCIARGEIPWASHVMFAWTDALYETDEEQRAEGIELNKQMLLRADKVVAYTDHGISKGMQIAITFAKIHGKNVEKRFLYK
jgi:hypothetical protein